MNDDQLENTIRAELAADAAGTPPATATKLAVRAAVAELTPAESGNRARRWLLPVAAAAVLVALVVAGFLVPKALTSRHPARPAAPGPKVTQPVLPPTPTGSLRCPSGQKVVDGLSTAFTDVNGAPRYAYEYYCAGGDGSRGFSTIEIYLQRQGKLVSDGTERVVLSREFVMQLAGTDGGLRLRLYRLPASAFGGDDGAVSDVSYPVDPNGSDRSITPVASDCAAADLKVTVVAVNEPVPHSALTATNTSQRPCAIWGTPKYTVIGSVPARIRYLLSGPAGGAEGLPSSPVLLVDPGHSVSASVGSDPIGGGGCQEVEAVQAVLPSGVSLGRPKLGVCDNLVAYPFVDSANGSITHPESEAPKNTASGSCVDHDDVAVTLGQPTAAGNHRHHYIIVVRTLSGRCTLSGFPDIRLLDPSGALAGIARQSGPGTAGGSTSPGVQTVTLSPGRPASVLVEWGDQAGAGHSCLASGSISMRLGHSGFAAGDPTGRVCDLQVHPFVAGTTGQ